MRVQPGARVLYPKYTGIAVQAEVDGEPLLLMRETDLLAVVVDVEA